MIESQSEFERTVLRLKAGRERLEDEARALRERGLSEEQVKRALDPKRSFYRQLEEEVALHRQSKGR